MENADLSVSARKISLRTKPSDTVSDWSSLQRHEDVANVCSSGLWEVGSMARDVACSAVRADGDALLVTRSCTPYTLCGWEIAGDHTSRARRV
eukprot:2018624-Prymnesium_polylepis.1